MLVPVLALLGSQFAQVIAGTPCHHMTSQKGQTSRNRHRSVLVPGNMPVRSYAEASNPSNQVSPTECTEHTAQAAAP